MGANMAGIYGAQIFRSDDKPRYRRAFVIGIGVLTLGTILAIARKVDEVLRRRRGPSEVQSDDDNQPPFSNPKAIPSDIQPLPALIDNDMKPVVAETAR